MLIWSFYDLESFEAKFEASNYEAMMIFMKLWQELVLIIFGKFIKASEREKEELIKALTSVLSKSNYMGKNIRKLFFFSHDCRLLFYFHLFVVLLYLNRSHPPIMRILLFGILNRRKELSKNVFFHSFDNIKASVLLFEVKD